MHVAIVIALLCSGVIISCLADWRPALRAHIERVSGALFIAGLVLLGLALPAAHHLGLRYPAARGQRPLAQAC